MRKPAQPKPKIDISDVLVDEEGRQILAEEQVIVRIIMPPMTLLVPAHTAMLDSDAGANAIRDDAVKALGLKLKNEWAGVWRPAFKAHVARTRKRSKAKR